jgi:hypothetical protein
MGLSGDWRDTFWGNVLYFSVAPVSAAAAVAFDDGFRPFVRVIAAALGVASLGLFIYALLRVLKVVPVVRGKRRLQRDVEDK